MTNTYLRLTRLVYVITVASVVMSVQLVQSQAYPSKPIRIIVGSSPGGAPDILARSIAQKLSDALGQQVVIDNRAGASGAIGAEITAKSAADGYTLLLSTTMGFAILPNLKKKIPYDAIKDFASVSLLAAASNVLVVNATIPAKTVTELIQIEKTKPKSLNFGSAGNGSPAHLGGEMLNIMAGTHMIHVPYKGAAPALVDVISGQIQFIITSPISAGPHMLSGKVRAIASTGSKRNPTLPELPTIAESLPGFEITQWWGLSAPTRTPAAVINQLSKESAKAINVAEVRDRILRDGAVAIGSGPQDYDQLIRTERRRYHDVIQKAGILIED